MTIQGYWKWWSGASCFANEEPLFILTHYKRNMLCKVLSFITLFHGVYPRRLLDLQVSAQIVWCWSTCLHYVASSNSPNCSFFSYIIRVNYPIAAGWDWQCYMYVLASLCFQPMGPCISKWVISLPIQNFRLGMMRGIIDRYLKFCNLNRSLAVCLKVKCGKENSGTP